MNVAVELLLGHPWVSLIPNCGWNLSAQVVFTMTMMILPCFRLRLRLDDLDNDDHDDDNGDSPPN